MIASCGWTTRAKSQWTSNQKLVYGLIDILTELQITSALQLDFSFDCDLVILYKYENDSRV